MTAARSSSHKEGILPTKRWEIIRLVVVSSLIVLLNLISVNKNDNNTNGFQVSRSARIVSNDVAVSCTPISIVEEVHERQSPSVTTEQQALEATSDGLDVSTNENENENKNENEQSTSGTQILTSASEEELDFWERSQCLYVENLCHVGHEWFYKPLNQTAKTQPLFALDPKDSLPPGYPSMIAVGSGLPEGIQCANSPITHHLVLTAMMDHMMGDFHHGVLRGAMHILKDHTSTISEIPEEQLQIYLHSTARHKLFDGHRIFSQTLPSNNPLLGFNELLDMNRCRCLPRVSFCGYSKIEPSPPATTNKRPVYQPFYSVGGGVVRIREHPEIPRVTRDTIMEEIFGTNPFMPDMVKDFRRKQLQQNRIAPDEEESWKIIGFGQRAGRRVWLGLREVIKQCNTKYRDQKILCIETSVELESSHVIMQAVMHAGLNGFIGIHGSQQVDALFMPTGSPVLELLPWFPDVAGWGRWTRSTKGTAHTWFQGTDLNHYGYPLGRSSTAHICNETLGPDTVFEDILCWKNIQSTDQATFMWDGRDYIVDWPIIDTFLGGFVVNPPQTCDEYQQHQQEQIVVDGNEKKQFTLYNVNCKLSPDSLTNANKNLVFLTNYTDVEDANIAVKLKAFEEWLADKEV